MKSLDWPVHKHLLTSSFMRAGSRMLRQLIKPGDDGLQDGCLADSGFLMVCVHLDLFFIFSLRSGFRVMPVSSSFFREETGHFRSVTHHYISPFGLVKVIYLVNVDNMRFMDAVKSFIDQQFFIIP
ncbi:MAG: hypothetical protein MZU84_02130 [Sphingobacterium sp.]|nr:hypothetical protein [Sphingobacterium sp.]